ncbi:hypothetical protein Mpet_2312 [Methanolacinia petrolearia DSM 11571]|uniref:Uncharacterized protein n=1 Tax=Methanolacinia petrolearia (strain DSM 11571 / OCM 486 / SEBR 4847) TaxID=679926 RepID=E1RD76_METP4|nr:hypothetical protein Mpet_2312 [Methanolacinia petrolearia DSM 11571]
MDNGKHMMNAEGTRSRKNIYLILIFLLCSAVQIFNFLVIRDNLNLSGSALFFCCMGFFVSLLWAFIEVQLTSRVLKVY